MLQFGNAFACVLTSAPLPLTGATEKVFMIFPTKRQRRKRKSASQRRCKTDTNNVTFSLWIKAAFSPKALPLQKVKGSKNLGAGGQRLKRICVCIRSGIARERGGKSYERFSAPTGLAAQTESRLPSFSSTPCTALFFFFRREKKKRGVHKAV